MADHTGGSWGAIDGGVLAAMRIARAEELLEAGFPDAALVEAEEYLDVARGSPRGLRAVARACVAIGDARTAVAALDAMAGARDAAGDEALLARALLEAAEPEQAALAAERALDAQRDQPEAWAVLAVARELLGHPAEDAWRRVRALGGRPGCAGEVPAGTWARALAHARRRLPGEVRAFLDGIPLLWFDLPDLEELRGVDPPLSPLVGALAAGLPDPDSDPWEHRPEAVRLYRVGLAWNGADADSLALSIRDALVDVVEGWLGGPVG